MLKFSQTVDTYNKHAGQFADYFEKAFHDQEYQPFMELVPAGGYILDAGCAAGRDSALFMERGFQVLGIDVSEGLLAEAAKRYPQVATQQMSLTNITLEDETYDAVWCKATLLHIERSEVPQVLTNFHRILKPGGVLFILTKAGEGEEEQPVKFDATLRRRFTFFSLSELEELVTAAGFTIHTSYQFNGKQRKATSKDEDWVVVMARR